MSVPVARRAGPGVGAVGGADASPAVDRCVVQGRAGGGGAPVEEFGRRARQGDFDDWVGRVAADVGRHAEFAAAVGSPAVDRPGQAPGAARPFGGGDRVGLLRQGRRSRVLRVDVAGRRADLPGALRIRIARPTPCLPHDNRTQMIPRTSKIRHTIRKGRCRERNIRKKVAVGAALAELSPVVQASAFKIVVGVDGTEVVPCVKDLLGIFTRRRQRNGLPRIPPVALHKKRGKAIGFSIFGFQT